MPKIFTTFGRNVHDLKDSIIKLHSYVKYTLMTQPIMITTWKFLLFLIDAHAY